MPNKQGEAWCAQHDCHPSDCFYIHSPHAKTAKGSLTAEEHQEAIKQLHIEKQKENQK